jgi:hypothetical protein
VCQSYLQQSSRLLYTQQPPIGIISSPAVYIINDSKIFSAAGMMMMMMLMLVIIIYLIFASGKGAVLKQISQKTAVCCMDSQMNCVAEQNLVRFYSN